MVLQYLPVCFYVKRDEDTTEFLPPTACAAHGGGADRACPDCNFHKGIVCVEPWTSKQNWTIAGILADGTEYKASFKRKQMPVVTAKASTLHVLQGTTANPGLIFHWKFPRRLLKDMRWLATYVALSRVESFDKLRSIGLTNAVREIIEGGPPEGLPRQFAKLFDEKVVQTKRAADEAMRCLGWSTDGA